MTKDDFYGQLIAEMQRTVKPEDWAYIKDSSLMPILRVISDALYTAIEGAASSKKIHEVIDRLNYVSSQMTPPVIAPPQYTALAPTPPIYPIAY